jgi:hypothetical protein
MDNDEFKFYDISFQYLRNNKKRLNQPIQTNTTTKEVREKDKKFYKKRILHLTNNLISGIKEPDDDINIIFEIYLHKVIQYFKMIDRNEIIQNEINGVVGDYGDIEKNGIEEQEQTNEKDKDDADFLHQNHNSSKKILQNDRIPTLDKFVKIKKRDIEEALETNPIILPQKIKYHLNDSKFKNKGIGKEIGKKNNKNNIYQDQDTNENKIQTTTTNEQIV